MYPRRSPLGSAGLFTAALLLACGGDARSRTDAAADRVADTGPADQPRDTPPADGAADSGGDHTDGPRDAPDSPTDMGGIEAPPDAGKEAAPDLPMAPACCMTEIPPGGDSKCPSVAGAKPPYAVTLRFTNAGKEPLFLRRTCQLEWDISDCPRGAPVLVSRQPCEYCRCGACDACAVCAPCATGSEMVPGGGAFEDMWAGFVYPTGDAAMCPMSKCWDEEPAPAGWYRVGAAVYASATDVEEGKPPVRVVGVTFPLPVPGGVLEVAVDK